MQKYVVGFMFDIERERILLVRKNRPSWQNGLLNGIGGKIEEGESPINAMCREFEEETGIKTFSFDWESSVRMYKEGKFEIFFFYCFMEGAVLESKRSITDEEIEIQKVKDLYSMNTVFNLKWIVPMILDNDYNNEKFLIDKIK